MRLRGPNGRFVAMFTFFEMVFLVVKNLSFLLSRNTLKTKVRLGYVTLEVR